MYCVLDSILWALALYVIISQFHQKTFVNPVLQMRKPTTQETELSRDANQSPSLERTWPLKEHASHLTESTFPSFSKGCYKISFTIKNRATLWAKSSYTDKF